MTSSDDAVAIERAPSLDEVRDFRRRTMANGYVAVRVRTHSKSPLAHAWQHGEGSQVLLDVTADALNTGLILAGLRCIDVDVDDSLLVSTILDRARQQLPDGALIRSRTNSPRLALLFRAANGQPPKRSIDGLLGKIEVLGSGQQLVIDGLHPSGVQYAWSDGRGPDTIKLRDLPVVSEQEIESFLTACVPLLTPGAEGLLRASWFEGPADRSLTPAMPTKLDPVSLNRDLSAGIEPPDWFADLPTEEKNALAKACLNVLDNRTTDPRENWLRVLFALGDAERLGCTDAHQLALEWSRQGASWTGEADFETTWRSYKAEPGGVTIGTLLSMARDAGFDVSPWRDPILAWSGSLGSHAPASTLSRPVLPHFQRARSVASLPATPPKRHWLHGVDIARGAVSLLVAPGGRGKSSWLVTLGLACASGRPLLGSHVFGGPLRVLLISAEDPIAEVALRLRAAMKHHGLVDSDIPGLQLIGADSWGLPLLSSTGNRPVLNESGWDALSSELDRLEPDVLMLDPLMSVMGGASQNDNAAAALFMGQLVGVAAKRRIGIMVVHHASKGRDPVSAESAMGAASFVNFSRISLGIEPLAEKDAGSIGLPPWEARNVFRVVGTKQNFTPPSDTDRWFRLVSVDACNAEPPIYPNGDKVAVVEVFQPGTSGATFPPSMVRDALSAIDRATIPLSPSKRATSRYAGPEIEKVIGLHRAGRSSEAEAQALLDHVVRSGLVKVDKVKVSRPGKGNDARDGLVLTSAGKRAVQNHTPQSPQPPATSIRIDAGGAPMGPPQRPRGSGGNAGGMVAGQHAPASDVVPRSQTAQDGQPGLARQPTKASTAPAPATEVMKCPQRDATGHRGLPRDEEAPAAVTEPAAPAPPAYPRAPGPDEAASEQPTAPNERPSTSGTAASPPPDFADLEIPDFLDRRKSKQSS